MHPDFIGFMSVFGALATLGVGVYTAIRFVNYRLRRMEHREVAGGVLAELDELRGRVHELEADRARVAELEERVDFAERILARVPEQLPAGSENKA